MRSAGDDLISVVVADTQTAQALAAELRESGDWMEAVAGIDSVVVRFDIATIARCAAEERLSASLSKDLGGALEDDTVIEVPIVYGGESGPDLELVCEQLDLSRAEFIGLHCGEYTVDMLGFTPGFAYIGGLDERLSVDRLPQPRQFVAAGSVGIAGGRTGLYALSGPGGWPLIGRTSCTLFDAAAAEPFTLAPGTTVVFSAVDSL